MRSRPSMTTASSAWRSHRATAEKGTTMRAIEAKARRRIDREEPASGFLSAQEIRERYGIDLVTAEVLRRGLLQLTQQMLRQMTRTSTAPIMRDYRDCTFQIHQMSEA